jgi:hypothetical protein
MSRRTLQLFFCWLSASRGAALLLASWLALPGVSVAQAPPPNAPSVTHVVPAALTPGKPTDITLLGGNLAGATSLWCNLPGQIELTPGIANNGKEAGKVTYRLTVPAGTPAGIGMIHVATDKGVSNPRLLLVDDLEAATDNGANKSVATAQEIKLPSAVEGACEPESYDFYKFSAKAGQRVAVDVFAKRLGSALDPTIRLLDSAGRTLATCDDDPGIAPDCRLAHTFAADGVYLIEVRDIAYAGGGAHRYRLRIGDLPLVSTAFPLAVKKGTTAQVQIAGPSAAGAPPIAVAVPPDARGAVWAGAKMPSGQGSTPVAVLASDINEAVETEPNDSIQQPTAVTLPAGLNGRFDRGKDPLARDVDHYRFEAKKADKLRFRVQTRTLGSPAMLSLRVLNPQGQVLAEVDDPVTSEISLDFAPPADGPYVLAVREWNGFSGPAYTYRIDARPIDPGFSLATDIEQINVPHSGVFVAKVTAVRHGYPGQIDLELRGLPPNSQVLAASMAGNANETTVRVTLPADVPAGKLLPIEIVGKGKMDGRQLTATADTLIGLRKGLPGVTFPPPQLLGSLAVGVGQPFPEFFQLAAAPIEYAPLFGQATFKVTAKRLNNFPDVITLAVEGLPQGFQAKVQPIAQGKADADITLTGPAELPVGEHKITIKGSGTFQNQPKTATLNNIVLKIVGPLDVAVAAPVVIAPGGKQKVKITAARRGGEQGEIAVELTNLPAGVTAPPGQKIPQGKPDVEIELSAAANAAPAKAANVIVVAKAKIKGKDISVNSPPVVVEVKKPEEKKAEEKKPEAKKAEAKK